MGIGGAGQHGKVGSKVYNELRKACQVGKTRSPVPNDSPVWCDTSTGLCERKSCRKWWKEAHEGMFNGPAEPWVDDRIEYEDLKDACAWVEGHRPTLADLNDYNRTVTKEVVKEHDEYCHPKWIEGYCGPNKSPARHGACTLPTGQHCKRGIILPNSEQDELANWEEPFKEAPVNVKYAPLPPPPYLGSPPMASCKPSQEGSRSEAT